MSKNKSSYAAKPCISLRYEIFNYDHGEPIQRRVVCAANRYGDLIITGARHFDKVMLSQLNAVRDRSALGKATLGFIDQFGVFMDREEALTVAVAAGQLNTGYPKTEPRTALFSEDLY